MDLNKKLAQWQAAELIDADTRVRIQAHEAAQHKPLMLLALLGLGAVTVGLGIISVTAANWDGISDWTKLALDLLLATGLAAAVHGCVRRGQPLATDVLIAIYYLFVLASIALLGQVYQLGSPTYQALLTWSAATAPLMLLAHSRWLGLLFFAGLSLSLGTAAVEWLDHLSDSTLAVNLGVTLAWAWPLCVWWLSRALQGRQPGLAAGLLSGSWASLLLGAFVCTLPFYESMHGNDLLSWGPLAAGLLALGLVLSLPRIHPALSAHTRQGYAVLLGLAWLALSLSTTFERGSQQLLPALLQLAMLLALAFSSARQGQLRTFNGLTALIALRILIIYFEIFGSMLDTGIGLITGGSLTLLMAWLWRRKSPQLARQLGGGQHGS